MTIDDVELGVIDSIGDTVKFLLECKEEGSKLSNQDPPSIFIVPSALRDSSPASFKPKIVCIGPLHRQDEILQGFEGQKASYLHDLLNLFSIQEQPLNECVQKVSGSINRIKACYGGLNKSYSHVQLTKMMVLDGCFIIDFIIRLSQENDRLMNNYLVTQSIIYDLLLIEYQIPFFVLEDFFQCIISKSTYTSTYTITAYMERIVKYYNIFSTNAHTWQFLNKKPTTHDHHIHLLGYIHNIYQPLHDIPRKEGSIPKALSAVELDMAGVYFTPSVDENWALAMKVDPPTIWSNPTLRMPVLYIHDYTDLVLRNFIVYEQSCGVRKYVTAYVNTMDTLVDTAEDVAVLAKSKVLVNEVSSNEKAADIINNICKELPITEFFYWFEWKELEWYYDGYWPQILAAWRGRDSSFSWNFIAIFAGIVLFVLTLLQTIYTVRSAN